jgi:outer membrane immunogenic protein
MGTVRGRVGYAFDQVLIYGTGGYAWADNRTDRLVARRERLGQPHPHRLDCRCRCRSHIRASGQSRLVPLSQLPERTYNFPGIIAGGVASGTLSLNSVQVGVNYRFKASCRNGQRLRSDQTGTEAFVFRVFRSVLLTAAAKALA